MPSEVVYHATQSAVRFAIYPQGLKGPRMLADISTTALREVFGARDGGESLIDTYRTHIARIQIKALTRYWKAPSMPILLDRDDFQVAGALSATAP